MFVVIGDWRMSFPPGDEQRAGLSRIVWTSSDDGIASTTFIVFDDRAAAEAFAVDVRGNIENQRRAGVENLSLVIHEVAAET